MIGATGRDFGLAVGFWLIALFPPIVRADVVTLNSGGLVHGNLVSSPAGGGPQTVSVKTASGSLIVLDPSVVRQLNRAARVAPKTAKPSSRKSGLAPEEEAWMPKVRALVSHLLGADRDQIRRARADVLRINDPDALPALYRYLGCSPNEDVRRLDVLILKNMPGLKPVDYLVEQSMLDPSAEIRDEARKAIKSERANAARPLYIQVLKIRDPNWASLAAQGIAEIGDPNGEAVPFLIDTLVFDTALVVAQAPPAPVLSYTDSRVVSGGSTHVHDSFDPGFLGTKGNISGWPLSPGRPVPLGGGAGQVPDLPPSTPLPSTYQPSTHPPRVRIVPDRHGNPYVLDSLVKVTDRSYPGFGYKPDEWRRWWDNEKTNRDLQKGGSKVDKKISTVPH